MVQSGHPDVPVRVVLDNGDLVTNDVCKKLGINQHQLDFGDVGEVRNWILDKNRDKGFLVLIDGDDLVSPSYFPNLFRKLSRVSEPAILLPQIRADFVENRNIAVAFCQRLSVPRAILRAWLLISNPWGSNIVIAKPAELKVWYPSESGGFLFEDWWFLVRVLESNPNVKFFEGIHWHRVRKRDGRLRSQQGKLEGSQNHKHPGIGPPKVRRAMSAALMALQAAPLILLSLRLIIVDRTSPAKKA